MGVGRNIAARYEVRPGRRGPNRGAARTLRAVFAFKRQNPRLVYPAPHKIMTFRFPANRRPPWLLLVVVFGASGPALAQKYRTAAGLRFSSGLYGLTVQQKVLPRTTLDGLLLAGPREVAGTVLAERHFGLLGPSLNYYLGAGAHVGRHKATGAFGGLDALAGVEYKIALSRFVVAADFKPSIEFNSADWARFATGLSVRYVLLRDKKTGLFDGLFKGNKAQEKRKSPGSRRGQIGRAHV